MTHRMSWLQNPNNIRQCTSKGIEHMTFREANTKSSLYVPTLKIKHPYVMKGKYNMFLWSWMPQKWKPTPSVLNSRSSHLEKEIDLPNKTNASIAKSPGTWRTIVLLTPNKNSSQGTALCATYKKKETKKTWKKERIGSLTSSR